MNLSRSRRAVIAAVLTTAAIAIPAGSAHAAPLPGLGAGWTFPGAWGDGIAATGWAGTPVAALGFPGPIVGQAAAVVGPTIITTAPSTFINTNNQVTAGSSVSGGQVSGGAFG